MRTCPDCSNDVIRAEASFCDLCGTPLPATKVSPAPAYEAAPSPPPVRPAMSRPPLIGRPPARPTPPQAPSGPRLTWREVELQGELSDELNIEGSRWVKVDEIEPRNRESEVQHSWSINDTKQIFQERGAKLWPDGREAGCRGYLHKGGFARFTVRNLAPGAPVAIVRQSWAEGQERGEIYVGEYTAGAFAHTDLDLQHALRNRVHLVPRSLVTGSELTIEQEDLGSDNGLYYFGLRFYQPGEAIDALSSQLARAAAASAAPVAPVRAANLGGSSPNAPRVAPAGVVLSWEAIKKMGRGLPERMRVSAKEWELIDYLAFEGKQSAEEHSFVIYDAENYFTYKVRATYPDGEVVEDSGIRWDTGHAEWTVGGTLLNRDLAVIVRVDVRECPGAVEVFCEDKSAGLLQIEGRDPVSRWRNWSHLIPGRLVSEGTARLRFQISGEGAGMNMFRLWFYQAR